MRLKNRQQFRYSRNCSNFMETKTNFEEPN